MVAYAPVIINRSTPDDGFGDEAFNWAGKTNDNMAALFNGITITDGTWEWIINDLTATTLTTGAITSSGDFLLRKANPAVTLNNTATVVDDVTNCRISGQLNDGDAAGFIQFIAGNDYSGSLLKDSRFEIWTALNNTNTLAAEWNQAQNMSIAGNLTLRSEETTVADVTSRSLGATFRDGSAGGRIEFLAHQNYSTGGNKDSYLNLFTVLNGVETRQLLINHTGSVGFTSTPYPILTESTDLGGAALEWDNLFVQNSPTISDERTKNDLGSVAPFVELMRELDGRIFSRKSKVVQEMIPEHTEMRQKTIQVKRTKERIEVIDGLPVVIEYEAVEERQCFVAVQVRDELGNLLVEAIPAVHNKAGKLLVPASTRPRMHNVPEMEEVTIPEVPEVVVTHGRPHTGLMAQRVKAAMDKVGIKDWAGYAYHNEEGEDLHVLRLLEFIAPLLAYIQEVENKVNSLKRKLG